VWRYSWLAYIVHISIPVSSTLSQSCFCADTCPRSFSLFLVQLPGCDHFPNSLSTMMSFPPIYATLSCESWGMVCDALIWWWWFLWMSDQSWSNSLQYRLNPLILFPDQNRTEVWILLLIHFRHFMCTCHVNDSGSEVTFSSVIWCCLEPIEPRFIGFVVSVVDDSSPDWFLDCLYSSTCLSGSLSVLTLL